MVMREFVIDVTSVTNFDMFVTQFNAGYCQFCGGHWHGRSWNAFHDYLSWLDDEYFTLRFVGWDDCQGLNDDDREMIRNILLDNPHVHAVFT